MSDSDEPVRIKLQGFPKSPDDQSEPSPAKRWIDHLYSTLPTNPLNPDQLALVYGEGADQQIALFELEPVKGDPKTVYVKWFQAYPMRQGVGTRAMKELQGMAGKAGLKLNLISWNYGKVSRRALDKFYKKAGFKTDSGKLGGLTWDPLSETDAVTFAGKDPREFTSPNGGKAAMVIVTAQGSRYLITDDGMVLRHKSAHANTGGDDQGLKNWSQHIEFYDPSDTVGGTTFPLAVSAAVSKNIPVALSTAPDGRRALAIFDNGQWRVAKISDVFKHVATDDVPIVGTYSKSPKLHWHAMDYDVNSKGMLSRVHPGSPVSHGAAIKHTVNENDDDDYGINDTPDIEGAKRYIADIKRESFESNDMPISAIPNTLKYGFNLDEDAINEVIEPIKSDIIVYINTLFGNRSNGYHGGHSTYKALRLIHKLYQFGIVWPELHRMMHTHKHRIVKYMLDKLKVNDRGVVQELTRILPTMGIDWPELVTIRRSVTPDHSTTRIVENDYAEHYRKIRNELKQQAAAAFEVGPEHGLNRLDILNLTADEVQGARDSLESHKHVFIKYLITLMKNGAGDKLGLARNTAYKLQGVGMKWPELDIFTKTVNDYFDDQDRKYDEIDEAGPTIDNVYGLGAVGISGNIDYRGLRVYVKPSVFLKLAARHPNMQTDYLQQHMSGGKAIGAPFLDIDIPSEWIDESSTHDQVVEGDLTDPAMIIGHEGRHRMAAILKEYGDVPIETHLLFRGLRRRHITDNMIERLNQDIVNESDKLYQGPWFGLTETVSETDDIDFDTNLVERDFLTNIRHYSIIVALRDISNKAERDARFDRDTAIYRDTVIKHKALIIKALLERMKSAEGRTEFDVIQDAIAYIVNKLKIHWREFNLIQQSCKAHVAALPDDQPPDYELDEKWSKKYKDSINCSNPKGFSQRAHCASKKQ